MQVRRDTVRLGSRSWTGEDLATLFVQPLSGDKGALVGAVGGSGIKGMRTTYGLPYFVSVVGYPDCMVLRANVLRDGLDGVIQAGFFGERWDIKTGVFSERSPSP